MTTPPSPVVWTPAGRVRGTLAVIGGGGERAAVYERFGRRLSADGYAVGVFESDAEAAAVWLERADDAPRVLVGSDSGAASVLRLLARGAVAEGGIVAGALVDAEGAQPADEERTACPLHLGVLADADSRTAVVPAEPLPPAADLAAIAVPVLAVHGGADPVSAVDAAAAALRAVPDLEFVETVGGLHDALNDQSHRSVAARVVLWLERLRGGDVHAPVVRTLAPVEAGRA
ncbi:alpha/beta hydrolase [Microbacterium sp. XT11]|uniref:alpha/beta hydrolase n=1 Tax=Microbacterium sp. XT11 TaxID=367477 RepID=UPI0008299A66|nr:hypothetical protein [Microbacterium sp. XT11]